MKHLRGFTLIELMIVVVIVAILAAVAIPNYAQYVQKSRRTEAKRALMSVTAAMEKYMLAQNAYPPDITTLNGAVGGHGLTQNGTQWESQGGNYRFSIIDNDSLGLRVRAVAQGSQANDEACATFFLWLDGRRSSFDSNSANSTDTCWED